MLKKSFPFVETKDQQKAIEDVYSDMNKNTPMDRLICGDVGLVKQKWLLGQYLNVLYQVNSVCFMSNDCFSRSALHFL